MPKATTPTSPGVRQGRRHNPLSDDLVASGLPKSSNGKRRKSKGGEDDETKFVDSKASRRILKIGRDLAEEDQEEHQASAPNTAFEFQSRFAEDVSEAEEQFDDNDEAWGDEEEEVIEEGVCAWVLVDCCIR